MSKILDNALLSAFLEASRSGSFGISAKNLGRSQPLLTHQIQRLEDIVGYRLFIRTPRGVTLTPKGAELLVYAQRIVAVSDDATKHFATKRRNTGRQIRVRLSEDLAGQVLLSSLLADASSACSFDLEIVSAGDAPVATAFDRGEVDIFLGDISPSLSLEPAKHAAFRLIWAASPNFDAGRRPLALGLYPASCGWRGLIVECLDNAQIDWFSALESESLLALQTAAFSEVVAIACLPSSLARGLITVDYKANGLPEPPAVEIAMYKVRPALASPELDELANTLWEMVSGQNPQHKMLS